MWNERSLNKEKWEKYNKVSPISCFLHTEKLNPACAHVSLCVCSCMSFMPSRPSSLLDEHTQTYKDIQPKVVLVHYNMFSLIACVCKCVQLKHRRKIFKHQTQIVKWDNLNQRLLLFYIQMQKKMSTCTVCGKNISQFQFLCYRYDPLHINKNFAATIIVTLQRHVIMQMYKLTCSHKNLNTTYL